MKKFFIQDIDYVNNSHFISYKGGTPFSTGDNIRIYELINSIDSSLDYLLNIEAAPKGLKSYQALAGRYLSELRTLLDIRSKSDSELNSVLLIIFDEAAKLVERYAVNATQNEDYTKDKAKFIEDNNLSDKVSLMKNQGYLEFQFDQSPEFLEWSRDQMDFAKNQYKDETDWRGANSYNPGEKGFEIIQRFIQENHILEIISAYKGMDMGFLYAAWDYAHNRQKWFRNNHEYGHLSPTNYYHFDADEDVSKMLIYLSDVVPGDGPFKFVSGSNIHARSTFLTYIYYIIDTKIAARFNKEGNLYGRGLFLYRKDLLMKFPTAFMGSTHFGDDLEENSLLSKYLLENTVVFERKKGAAVLFDGYKGIHAGGNADTGERLAVQIAFRRKRSFMRPLPLLRRIKNYIRPYFKKP